MEININTTKENFTTMYLVLWNGSLGLTPKELDTLAVILDKYLSIKKDKVPEPYLSKVTFSTESRKDYYRQLETTSFNFQNILGHLVEKGVVNKDEEGNYSIDPRVVPVEEITFKFNIQ